MLVSEGLPVGALRNTIYCGAVVAAGLNRKTLDFEDVPSDDRQRSAEVTSHWQLSSFTQTARGTVLFCGGFGLDEGSVDVDPRALGVRVVDHLVLAEGGVHSAVEGACPPPDPVSLVPRESVG